MADPGTNALRTRDDELAFFAMLEVNDRAGKHRLRNSTSGMSGKIANANCHDH
jgi:hypothetical protein